MIASLPMYDRPALHGAHDRLWGLIRDGLRALGIAAPDGLTRDGALWDHWQSPDLMLSQTCGLPFRARLHDRVALVATPDFGLEGCPPGYYHSVLVARADDARSDWRDFDAAPFAYNEGMSQSGWAAPREAARALGIRLVPTTPTGSHLASALAVLEGRADHASLDAQSWRLMQRHEGWADGLRVIARTRPTPGLPLITAPGRDSAAIRQAVAAAIRSLTPEDRAALGLRGIVDIPVATYLSVPIPEAPQEAPQEAP